MFLRPCLAVALVIALVTSLGGPSPSSATSPQDEPDVKPASLERLNSTADEDDPCLSPDGLRLFFTCNRPGNFEVMAAEKKPPRQTFFANPKPVEELNSNHDEAAPLPLPREADGSEYIFLARNDGKNLDIFFTRKLSPGEPYMRSALAAILGVCTPEDETHPWLIQVGRNFELYFSRRTAEGWKIGVAKSDAPRIFDENKVKLLDFPAGFAHATVSADGRTMYLQGPVDEKRTGLFVSRRAGPAAVWSKPAPLTMLNSSEGPIGDRSPSLSRPKGEFLYFASDRAGGKGGLDLYVVETRLLR